MPTLAAPSLFPTTPRLLSESDWMTQELETTFRELGLAQYLDSFVDQGFDTWDTILDIQESDLDALGVKLGHRRKLQRRIANARGVAPNISLGSPKSISDGGKRDGSRPGQGREANVDGTGVVKRKYRRHPKPDENAPERSPSAYVLFSNSMLLAPYFGYACPLGSC